MRESMLYHYTSHENINLIHALKALKPSTFWSVIIGNSEARQVPYTHALLDHPLHYGWTATGLISFRDSATHIIEFPMETSKGVLIREAYHLTPDNMISVVGKNLWELIDNGMTWAQFYTYAPYINYVNSTIPIHQYDDSFLAPEVMVPYEVSLRDMKIIPRSELQRWEPHNPLIRFPVKVVATLNT